MHFASAVESFLATISWSEFIFSLQADLYSVDHLSIEVYCMAIFVSISRYPVEFSIFAYLNYAYEDLLVGRVSGWMSRSRVDDISSRLHSEAWSVVSQLLMCNECNSLLGLHFARHFLHTHLPQARACMRGDVLTRLVRLTSFVNTTAPRRCSCRSQGAEPLTQLGR